MIQTEHQEVNQPANQYIDGNKTVYLNVEKILRAATSITRKSDGISFELSLSDKAVYEVMRDSYFGYHSAGLIYYEDQEMIAARAGVSVPTVKRAIKKWRDLGLIEVNTIRTALGNKSNSYKITSLSLVLDDYVLTTPDLAGFNQRGAKIDSATQNLAVQAVPEPTEIPGSSPEEPDYFTGWDDVDPTVLEPAHSCEAGFIKDESRPATIHTEPPTATLNDIREFAYQHKAEFRGSCINIQRLIDVYETATGRVFNRQHHAALVNDGQLERYISDDGDIYDYATSSDDIVF
ncbi:TPA: hypothetical protein SMI10_002065 [Serratia liquefaciens]|nr:hypothetical protein [Serratia liquefaciens]